MREDVVVVAIVTILVMVILALLELPFAYYQGFLLEHRYGLSNQDHRGWLPEQGWAHAIVINPGSPRATFVAARNSFAARS